MCPAMDRETMHNVERAWGEKPLVIYEGRAGVKAKPIQNTASTGSRTIARTPPTLDPFHTSHAAQATASATMRNAIKSHTKVRWLTREDQGPPYISKGPKNVGRVPRRERQTATGIVEIPNPAA